MEKIFAFLCASIILISVPSPGSAELVRMRDTSGSVVSVVVYDTEGEQYWYWDLSRYVNMNWAEQESAVADLNIIAYYGLTNWHVPDLTEMSEIWSYSSSELTGAFNPSYVPSSPSEFPTALVALWYGRFDYTDVGIPSAHAYTQLSEQVDGTIWKQPLLTAGISDLSESEMIGVSATSNGYARIPEPATMLLLGSGLLGLAGFRRRFRKR